MAGHDKSMGAGGLRGRGGGLGRVAGEEEDSYMQEMQAQGALVGS